MKMPSISKLFPSLKGRSAGKQKGAVAASNAPVNLSSVANNAYRPARRLIQALAIGLVILVVVVFLWVKPKQNLITTEAQARDTAQVVFSLKTREALVARAADASDALSEAQALDALLPLASDTLDVLGAIEDALMRSGHTADWSLVQGASDVIGPAGTMTSEVTLSMRTTEAGLRNFFDNLVTTDPLITVSTVAVDINPNDGELNVIARMAIWSMPDTPIIPS